MLGCGNADRASATLLRMKKWLRFVCLVVAVPSASLPTCAQFTDAHTYDNTPIGINQLELNYAYVHANASIDTSLVIAGARLNLNQGTINYTHYFGLAKHLMWVSAGFPVAGLSGDVTGANIRGSTTGAGDSSYQVAALLKGGQALTVAQFENYKPTTTLGVSLTIIAPTGLYHPQKILNLGSDRRLFKPEIALSHPFGPELKWQVDAYANVYFYTTTPRITEGRFCDRSRYLDSKDISAIRLATASGPLLIRATLFGALRSSAVSIKTMANRISSWAAR